MKYVNSSINFSKEDILGILIWIEVNRSQINNSKISNVDENSNNQLGKGRRYDKRGLRESLK